MNRMWKIVAGLVVLMMVASASLGVGVVIGGSGLPLWGQTPTMRRMSLPCSGKPGTSCIGTSSTVRPWIASLTYGDSRDGSALGRRPRHS